MLHAAAGNGAGDKERYDCILAHVDDNGTRACQIEITYVFWVYESNSVAHVAM